MLSAFLTLANLWDITITVLFFAISYIAFHIFSSLSTSIFEVASSNIYISGFVIIVLAKANLCFWPTDNNDRPSPTSVCNFSGKLCTKSYKLAFYINYITLMLFYSVVSLILLLIFNTYYLIKTL